MYQALVGTLYDYDGAARVLDTLPDYMEITSRVCLEQNFATRRANYRPRNLSETGKVHFINIYAFSLKALFIFRKSFQWLDWKRNFFYARLQQKRNLLSFFIHCCFLFGIRGNPRLFMFVNIKPVGLHFCRIWVAQHVISLHQELFCLAYINVSSPQQRGMCLAVSLLPCRQTQGTF